MSHRFENRIAFITGAAVGLGKASALMLAREGARMMLFDKDEAGLKETLAACPGSISYVGDSANWDDVKNAADQTLNALGPVELLAPAAGIIGPPNIAIETSDEDFDRVFNINVRGPWYALKAIIPQMRIVGKGSIVLFSSSAGLAGSPFYQIYSASKGAIALLVRSLAITHAPENIRINGVAPYAIYTPMARHSFEMTGNAKEREAAMISRTPMKRLGEADEVAEAVLYFLSDAAAYTTGVVMPIDGGRLA